MLLIQFWFKYGKIAFDFLSYQSALIKKASIVGRNQQKNFAPRQQNILLDPAYKISSYEYS